MIPTSAPIPKIKVKVFGHSASGKTSLIESMRAGYFTGLFRRSKRGSCNKVRHRTNTKGEEDVIQLVCMLVSQLGNATWMA